MVFNVSEVHNLQLVAEGDSEFGGGGNGFLIKFALWCFFEFSPWPKKLSIILVPLNNHIIVVQWGL